MRSFLPVLLLAACLLPACGSALTDPQTSPSPPPASSAPVSTTTRKAPSPLPSAQLNTPISPPVSPAPSPTAGLPAVSAFTLQPAAAVPAGRPLIAVATIRGRGKSLLLADPAGSTLHEFTFPAAEHFATPFLAGLSPDARYFATFEGGILEEAYGTEHLRLSTPGLHLHVWDLLSGEVVFSTPLLSPSFPQDLEPVAEAIQDEWHFTSQDASLADIVAATQELLLDRIRNIAWSPDSSLLAFASQDPGPTSDLYFYSPEGGSARRVSEDPGHVLSSTWAPDSSVLLTETSLYDRHAREDTNLLVARDGSLRGSFTSQITSFHSWHNASTAFLWGSTDAGDYFELKTLSAADGEISLLWDGSWGDIAFSPDLSTFLASSFIPTASIPPHPGLFLGSLKDGSLQAISEETGWSAAYWGSDAFPFAASSLSRGTFGVTLDGELVHVGEGFWRLAASPDGSYLTGINRLQPGSAPQVRPGLRLWDDSGQLLEAVDEVNVICAAWNAASTALAFQAEKRLYLWEAASGSTRLVTDWLDEEECGFRWVRDHP